MSSLDFVEGDKSHANEKLFLNSKDCWPFATLSPLIAAAIILAMDFFGPKIARMYCLAHTNLIYPGRMIILHIRSKKKSKKQKYHQTANFWMGCYWHTVCTMWEDENEMSVNLETSERGKNAANADNKMRFDRGQTTKLQNDWRQIFRSHQSKCVSFHANNVIQLIEIFGKVNLNGFSTWFCAAFMRLLRTHTPNYCMPNI